MSELTPRPAAAPAPAPATEPAAEPARPPIARSRRTVIKVGTRVLTDDDGRIALARFSAVVDAAGRLRRRGVDVLVVTSGAVGLGREALGLASLPEEVEERQACAAVGQGLLMSLYSEAFRRLGVVCGQVLLTQGDFEDRTRYLNLRNTLTALLRRGAVPVINENDAVGTEELAPIAGETRRVFGDNDRLSALVAAELDADLLVLLTDVEGVYDRDPRQGPGARLVATLPEAGAAEGWSPAPARRPAAAACGARSRPPRWRAAPAATR